ncbi:MAG TPA: hypothetical protein PKC25_17525, partial [Candidatus Rifleibacterium sp.]|nr:hypothetical protein [Candidatus Rifleibacterium sp.]
LLNNQPAAALVEFLEQQDIIGIPREQVEEACRIAADRPVVPTCGSDSSGRNKMIPGMGFIRSSMISPAVKEKFLEKHFVIPKPIGSLIINHGKWAKDLPHEESDNELLNFWRFWQYLNPGLKNMLRLFAGFSVALYWMMNFQFEANLFLGAVFAAIWFMITFNRNVFVDLIASSGTDFKRWSLHNVNFDNAYQSLIWTGFSVPVMGLVKNNFDLFWPYMQSGMLYESSKFFFIRLRNFDRSVIKANFFRSVLSWPVAAVFAPAGNLMGVPSIVQAKFWSDVVAGFIEGGAKFSQRFTLRKRDLTEILPRLYSEERNERLTAMLDILYIWARAP